MPYNQLQLLKDALGNPIPQVYDPVADAFTPLEGSGGATRMWLSGGNVVAAEAVPGGGAGDDATDLPSVADSTYDAAYFLFVGTGGDVTLTVGGSDILFAGLAGGMWHPMPPFTRVKATGTTAGQLVAGYGYGG